MEVTLYALYFISNLLNTNKKNLFRLFCTPCLSLLAESTLEGSRVKIRVLESLPIEKGWDFLPPQSRLRNSVNPRENSNH